MNNPTLLLGLFLGAVASSAISAAPWQVDYSTSVLKFTALQEGRVIEGHFTKFDADIWFDSAQLTDSRFQVCIDMKSVDTGSSERDEILESEDFFHTARWPKAYFKTLTIEHKGGIKHEASARLKIRDIEQLVKLPFDLKISSEQSPKVLFGEGRLKIDRFDFDMARGDWSDTSVVGAEIDIHVTIRATLDNQAPPLAKETIE